MNRSSSHFSIKFCCYLFSINPFLVRRREDELTNRFAFTPFEVVAVMGLGFVVLFEKIVSIVILEAIILKFHDGFVRINHKLQN